MTAPQLTITQVARRAGIRPSAIRYYESVGLLPVPARVNGRRRYDESVIRQLTIIAAVKEIGFSIAEIAILMHGFSADTSASARWRAFAEGKQAAIDALILRAEGMQRMLHAMSQCDCPTLDVCADALAARTSIAS